jgi:hypothetical protein
MPVVVAVEAEATQLAPAEPVVVVPVGEPTLVRMAQPT